MKPIKTLRKKLNQRFAQKQDELERVPGEMTKSGGNLIPPGLNNFVYVAIADRIMPVFNNRVAPQAGVKVWVGYANEEPTLFQVLSTRSETPASGNLQGIGYAPAKRYEWNANGGGQDPLSVHLRAFSPLKLSPSATGGMNVSLYKGTVHNGTTYYTIATQDIDLTAHIPAGAGKAALVMITINNVGSVVQTKGSEVDITALVASDRPAVPANTIFVCGCVRVYNGQTVVKESRANTDFDDMRFPGLFISVLNVGTGTAGQVVKWGPAGNTLVDAALIPPASNILTLTATAASTLAMNVSAGKTLTLTATDNFNLTIPATGVAALLATQNVFSVNQFIDGSADAIQLRIQGHSTQTANLITLEKSDGTVYAGFDKKGRPFSTLGLSVTNFFAGTDSGDSVTSGTWNIGIGENTLKTISTHTWNVAIGWSAQELATGLGNTTIGYQSGKSLTGSGNVGIGVNTLLNTTSGAGNFALGTSALWFNVTGSNNVAIGAEAGSGVSTKSHSGNVFIGQRSGYVIQTGSDNVCIGLGSGTKLATGNKNVFIGEYTGVEVLGGERNVFVGYTAGYNQTGSNLLIIDSIGRASAAVEVTNSIIYGVIAATPAAQTLRLNAVVTTTQIVAATNTVTAAHIIRVESTGTAAAGFGGALRFDLETATADTIQTVGQVAAILTDPTNATRNERVQIDTYPDGTVCGHSAMWSKSAIADSAFTIIADGTGDVTEAITIQYSAAEITGTYVGGGVVTLEPGDTSNIVSDGTSVLTLTCAANGSVTIARSAGTDTFKFTAWMVWI